MKGKGTAALIIGFMGKKKPGASMDEGEEDMAPESEEGEGDMGEAKQAAAEEVMAAVKANDAKALADALESFIECCGE